MTEHNDRLDVRSHDVVSDEIQKLLEIFPSVRSEDGRVNFEALKTALGGEVSEGRERFGMSWPGKAESIRAAQKQSVATLLPVEKESVDFESTGNVIIEGDNLEVLKLLQKSYLGKVKMIYIDPPYNTGNDFIYPDNYSESLQTYLEYTGQVGDDGKRFSTTTETDGRFHSKWMSMMYPRLMLARNLLTEDGVIFISIDDNELSNLRTICDETFGEGNRVAIFTWIKKRKASNLDAQVRSITEYVVAYRKSSPVELVASEDVPEENKPYPFYNSGNPRKVLSFPKNFVFTSMADGKYKKGKYEDNRTLVTLLDDVEVKSGIVTSDFRLEGEWRYSQANLDEKVRTGERIEIKGTKFKPYWINNSERTKFVRTLLNKETYNVGTNEDGNEELAALLGNGIFDFPKPASLGQKLVEISSRNANGIFLDFFAGSGTTGHAVLAQNAKDGGSRRFILVQLPEPVEEGSEAAKAGFETIADITKERVRRAAKEIAKEAGGASKLKLADGSGQQDLGFRVFKLDKSNFRVWDAAAPAGDEAKLVEQLELQVEHVEKGRKGQDVVFEVLLKSKLPLTSQVEKTKVSGGEVWSVESGRLVVVVDEGVDLAGIRELAKRDPKPETVVFLDRCFGGKDSLKANARKIFQDANIDFKTI